MRTETEQKKIKSELLPIWIIFAFMAVMPVNYIIFCHYLGDEIKTVTQAPILLRSILYFVVIITFPLINLIRHIMLRLNQTMPGSRPAKARYLITVLISLVMAEAIGLLGVLLFLLGDDFNTLIIFCVLSLLAFVLYRPKPEEYSEIKYVLQRGNNNES